MNQFKKIAIMMLFAFSLTFTVSYLGLGDFNTTEVAEATIKSKVNSNSSTTLNSTVDKAGSSLVKLARDIAVVVLVLVIIWAGYSLFVKKSAEGLADLKGRMGVIVVAIAFIFFAEQIIGAILKLFGATL